MRDAINGAWLYGIVLVFMTILIAYVAIQLNYSNVYQLKSDLVTIIEQNQGLNQRAINAMDDAMKARGYRTKRNCRSTHGTAWGVVDGNLTSRKNPTTPQNVCVYRKQYSDAGSQTKYYYEVEVFFGFNLPVLGEIYQFIVNGETSEIYFPVDDSRVSWT